MSDLWYSLITLVSQYTQDVVTYKTSEDLRPLPYIKHPWYTNQSIKLLNFVKPDHVWRQSRAHHRRLWSDAWPEAPQESSSPPYARRASCPRWQCCLGSSGGSTWIDAVWQTREGCRESIQEPKCHRCSPIYPSTTRWWTTLVLCLTIPQILMATRTHILQSRYCAIGCEAWQFCHMCACHWHHPSLHASSHLEPPRMAQPCLQIVCLPLGCSRWEPWCRAELCICTDTFIKSRSYRQIRHSWQLMINL